MPRLAENPSAVRDPREGSRIARESRPAEEVRERDGVRATAARHAYAITDLRTAREEHVLDATGESHVVV